MIPKTLRYLYDPFTKALIKCGESGHGIYLDKRGKRKNLDEYMRVMLIKNILYIRTFYPFDDITELNDRELKKKSIDSCNYFIKDILNQFKKIGIIPDKAVYNVEKDLIKGILLEDF